MEGTSRHPVRRRLKNENDTYQIKDLITEKHMAKNTRMDTIRYRNTLAEIITIFVVGLVYVTLLPANIIDYINNVYGNITLPALAGIKDVLGYAVLIVISFVFGLLNYVIVRLVNSRIYKCEALLLLGKPQADENRQSINGLIADYIKEALTNICLLLVVAWVIATLLEPLRIFNAGYLILILVALLVVLFRYLSGEDAGGESILLVEYEEAYKKMFAAGVFQRRITTLEVFALFTSNIILPLLVLLFSNSIITEVTNKAVLWIIAAVLYGIEVLFQISIIRFVWKGSK